ncbi:MAG: chorismate synthase [Deltaproteobacteria bacterium]|nr:MAG: chorismate synthase [Deltaproteobacteria bacterium]
MGSSFGRLLRVTTYGESHGGGVGCILEGCPPGLRLDLERVQAELDRRRPGQSSLTTPRKELDKVEILSGLFEGRTLGTPIAMAVRNQDADPAAYRNLKDRYRPSHADFTYEARYGLRAWAGGGRASARETVGRVAAGAIARQILEHLGPVQVVAWVERVHDISAQVEVDRVSSRAVDAHPVRCPDPEAAALMEARIREVRRDGDTVGGVIRCVARGVPAGLGAPVFDKLEADLARGLLSLPACKGFEIGSGYPGTFLKGSQHNDAFVPDGLGGVATKTNRSGGIQGGISNGMPIVLSAAFKPVATIFKEQQTVNDRGEAVLVKPRGRHDPCVLPRAVPMVEAMVCLVLADHWLRWRGQVGSAPLEG